jgi:hypothetical protein
MHRDRRDDVVLRILILHLVGASGVRNQPARPVVRFDFTEIADRRHGLDWARGRQSTQALDFAALDARIHAHGIRLCIVAISQIASLAVELARAPRRGIALHADPATHVRRVLDGVRLPAHPAIRG